MTEFVSQSSNSLCDEEITFSFVTETKDLHNNCGSNVSNLMDSCYKKVVEQFEDSNNRIDWITFDECNKLTPGSLTRKDIFILENFECDTLKYLQLAGAFVLGPICVLNCFNNDVDVPDVPGPVFSNILQNLCVCTTGISLEIRVNLKKLINFMGGNFESSDMTSATTHLLVNKSLSSKYNSAQNESICMITPNWVDDLWETCKTDQTIDLELFTQKYKVDLFYNIGFTATGLSVDQKTKLKTIIEKYGGKFFGMFQSKSIDILIMQPDQINSDKYKAAIKNRKICLTMEWVYDSVRDGHQKPFNLYSIKSSIKTGGNDVILESTPRKYSKCRVSSFIGNATSNLSEIVNTTVNDTIRSNAGSLLGMSPKNSDNTKKCNSYIVELNNLTKCKPRGQFLSGCNIFLCGFQLEEMEKITKIIRSSGCSTERERRFNVTYIIVGEPNEKDLQYLNTMSCAKVKLSWLTASIKQGSPASETEHLYQIKQKEYVALQISPITHRKTLTKRRLYEKNNENSNAAGNSEDNDNKNSVAAGNDENDEDDNDEDGEDDDGSGDDNDDDDDGKTSNTSDKTGDCTQDTRIRFLSGLSIMDYGFVNESHDLIIQEIESVGGKMYSIGSHGQADYLIVPTDIFELKDEILKMAKVVVNELWLQESIKLQKCAPIAYYHQPIIVKNHEQILPLENLTIVVTIYSGEERDFLENLIHALGATLNSTYVKSEQPILISPRPEGQKFNGAMKWGLPVVTGEWLLQCLKTWSKVSMNLYLVLPDDEDIIQPTCKMTISTTPETDSVFKDPLIMVDEPTTPALRNRRLSEILLSANKYTPDVKKSQREIYEDVLCDINIPNRELIIDMLTNTPNANKRVNYLSTPDLERYIADVYKLTSESRLKEKQHEFWKSLVTKPSNKPKQITFSEAKKNFWKSRGFDNDDGDDDDVDDDDDDDGDDGDDDGGDGASSNTGVADSVPEHLESPMKFLDNKKQNKMYFSSLNEDIEEIQMKLVKLNVSLSELSYAHDLTHIICEKPTRSESIFCGIAAGRWIMSLKFIDDSFDSGNILNEELYEWGNPKAQANLPPIKGLSKSIAAAAYRWRIKLNSGLRNNGAFKNFKVILHMKKKISFKNFIESGKGVVLEISEPYADSEDILKMATHCICGGTMKPSDSDRSALLKANVLCVNNLFLESYILSEDDVPDPQKFSI